VPWANRPRRFRIRCQFSFVHLFSFELKPCNQNTKQEFQINIFYTQTAKNSLSKTLNNLPNRNKLQSDVSLFFVTRILVNQVLAIKWSSKNRAHLFVSILSTGLQRKKPFLNSSLCNIVKLPSRSKMKATSVYISLRFQSIVVCSNTGLKNQAHLFVSISRKVAFLANIQL
jgi:hypothetical protein